MDDLVKQLRDVAEATGPNHARQIALDAADRIEALEARVAAADKLAVILAAAMHEHDTADYGYGEENPWTMREWFSDEDRAALSAYQATKEGE